MSRYLAEGQEKRRMIFRPARVMSGLRTDGLRMSVVERERKKQRPIRRCELGAEEAAFEQRIGDLR
jgi:hypothetical protein